MADRCTYTLSRLQIFLCLIRPWMFTLYIASTVLFFACAGFLVWLLFTGRMGYEDMVIWILVIGLLYVLLDIAALGFVYYKAGKAPHFPAGETVAEWDELGISFRAGQEYHHIPWGTLKYRLFGKDMAVFLPDGRFTLLASPPLDKGIVSSIRQCLANARRGEEG